MLPEPRVLGGVRDASLLPAGTQEEKTAPLSACSHLHHCLPVLMKGLKCSGWGAASAGTRFVLVAQFHQRPWDVASATRGSDVSTDSRRQQVTFGHGLNCCLLELRKFGSHLPDIKVELKAREAGSLRETHQSWQCPWRSCLPSSLQCCRRSHPFRLGVPEWVHAVGHWAALNASSGSGSDAGPWAAESALLCSISTRSPVSLFYTQGGGCHFMPPHISPFVPPFSCWAPVSHQCLSCPSVLPLLPVALLGPECNPAVLSFCSAMLEGGVGGVGALPGPAGLHSS